MKFRPGVLTGQEVTDLLNYANENDFALTAVNVTTQKGPACERSKVVFLFVQNVFHQHPKAHQSMEEVFLLHGLCEESH